MSPRRPRAMLLAMLLAASAPALGQANPTANPTEVQQLRSQLDAAMLAIKSLSAKVEALEASQKGAAKPAALAAVAPKPVAAAKANPDALVTAKGVDVASVTPGPLGRPNTGFAPDNSGTSAVAFQLSAGTGGGRAAFTLSQTRDRAGRTRSDGTPVGTSDAISITASAPLADEGPTDIATLDGLAGSSELKFSFTRFQSPIPSARSVTAVQYIREKAIARCEAEKLAEKTDYKLGCRDGVDEDFRKRFVSDEDQITEERGYARASIQKARGFGLEASIGHDTYVVRDPVTLSKSTVTRIPWSIGGNFTMFPADASALLLTGAYQEKFEAKKSRTLCPVKVDVATVECFTGAFGAPDRMRQVLLTGEYRHIATFAAGSLIPRLGIAPKVEYDANSNDFAFDLPIYLVPDAKGNLLGGIRMGYTTRDKDFIAGVFIGSSFSLF